MIDVNSAVSEPAPKEDSATGSARAQNRSNN